MLKIGTVLLTLYISCALGHGGGWQDPNHGAGLYPDLPARDDTPGYPNAPPEHEWRDDDVPPAYGDAVDRVKLQDIKVLTLRDGEMTTGRRSSPLQQLKCVGGSAKGLFYPSVVQCYNRGFDGTTVQWECKADMDTLYRFGDIQVACEGYDYPGDPYILAGSCGLEYTLQYTRQGRQDQQDKRHQEQHHQQQRGRQHQSKTVEYTAEELQAFWDNAGTVFYVVKVAAVIFMLLNLWSSESFKSPMGKIGLLIIAASLLYFPWKYIMIIGVVVGFIYCCSMAPNRSSEYPSASPGAGGWNAPGSGPSSETFQDQDHTDRQYPENRTSSSRTGSTRRRNENRNEHCDDSHSDDEITPGTRTASGFGGTKIR